MNGEQALVLAGRCLAPLGHPPTGDAWGDTWLELGDDAWKDWECVIHGARIAVSHGRIRVGDAFSVLPVAVLTPGESVFDELVS